MRYMTKQVTISAAAPVADHGEAHSFYERLLEFWHESFGTRANRPCQTKGSHAIIQEAKIGDNHDREGCRCGVATRCLFIFVMELS